VSADKLRSVQEPYAYKEVGGVLFVEHLPPEELEYRLVEPDGTRWKGKPDEEPPPTTWAGRAIDTQLKALGRYQGFATSGSGALPWLGKALDLFRRFVRKTRWKLAFPDDGPALRQGQRIVTAAGKVGFTHLRGPTEDTYLAGAGSPFADDRRWLSDEVFAHLRLAGMNPNLVERTGDLERVRQCADLEVVRRELGGDDLDDALAEERIFIVDPEAFELLRDVPAASDFEHPQHRRFACAPTAVFVRDADSRFLRPLAIRCGDESRFRTLGPADGELWTRAKIHYAVAEGTYQTYVSHQPQTHFFMELIAIASRRTFRHFPQHPLAAFLEPHIEGVMAVNSISRATLYAEDSPFDEFIAFEPAEVQQLVKAAYAEGRERVSPLPVPELGPGLCFPFGDDYRRLEELLRRWAGAFVDAHWSTASLADDDAVEMWVEELRCKAGLELDPITTPDALTRLLGHIVCIATIQHAAFHFPQSDLGRCAAITPLYAADLPPGDRMADAEVDARIPALKSLPDVHAAGWQAFVLNEADVHWRTLRELTRHPRIAELCANNSALSQAAADLDRGLDESDREIDIRNAMLEAAGLPRYEYLRASCQIICSPNT
jgi:hypothetical protein